MLKLNQKDTLKLRLLSGLLLLAVLLSTFLFIRLHQKTEMIDSLIPTLLLQQQKNVTLLSQEKPILDAINSKAYFPELRIAVELNEYTRRIYYAPQTNLPDTQEGKWDSIRIKTFSTEYVTEIDDKGNFVYGCDFNISLVPQGAAIDDEYEGSNKVISNTNINGMKYEITSNYDSCVKYVDKVEYNQIIKNLENAVSY